MLIAQIIRFISTILLIVIGVYPETGIATSVTLGLIAFAVEINSNSIRHSVE